MKPIEILLLVIQVAVVLAAAWAMVGRRPTAARRRPIWSSLTISLLVIAMASFNVVERHAPGPGPELVRFGGAVLIGFAVAMALMGLREHRFGTAV